MPVLTLVDEAFADAWGLALAALDVTELVEERTGLRTQRLAVRQMQVEAEETQARCHGLALTYPEDRFEELRSRAQTAKSRAAEMARPWFKAGSGGREAWTFLASAEAAEVAAWTAEHALARRGGDRDRERLASWALELQRRHLRWALDGLERIAARSADLETAIL